LEDFFGRYFLGGVFFVGFFEWNFLGRFFWEDVFGRIFWEDFFGRNYLGGTTRNLCFCQVFRVIFSQCKKEGEIILILRCSWHLKKLKNYCEWYVRVNF
jgi:hypothetical protein